MVHSDEEDLENQNEQWMAEREQLQKELEVMKQKYVASEGEVKFLLRKAVKLLEEKVERLEEELGRHVDVLPGIVNV